MDRVNLWRVHLLRPCPNEIFHEVQPVSMRPSVPVLQQLLGQVPARQVLMHKSGATIIQTGGGTSGTAVNVDRRIHDPERITIRGIVASLTTRAIWPRNAHTWYTDQILGAIHARNAPRARVAGHSNPNMKAPREINKNRGFVPASHWWFSNDSCISVEIKTHIPSSRLPAPFFDE